MNWNTIFYEWFLAELIRTLMLEERSGNYQASETNAVNPGGHVVTGASGLIVTPRQSNLYGRPETYAITEPNLPLIFGDSPRGRQPMFPGDDAAPLLIPGLYPMIPPYTDQVNKGTINHRFYTGPSSYVNQGFLSVIRVPRPTVLPINNSFAARKLEGHKPPWGNWTELTQPGVIQQAYGFIRHNDNLFIQGVRSPLWESLSPASAAGLRLPIDTTVSPHVLNLIGMPRGFASNTTAAEEGPAPAGSGLFYLRNKAINVDLLMTPNHITIWPGGDFATRQTQFWWQFDAGIAEPDESVADYDNGLFVNALQTNTNDLVTVQQSTVPSIRVAGDNTTTEHGSVRGDVFTFTPNGTGDEINKIWDFDRTWEWTRQVIVQPSDWVHSPVVPFFQLTSPLAVPIYTSTGDISSIHIYGGFKVKNYDGETETGIPWLEKNDSTDPGDWEWYDCVIHTGDYVTLYEQDPTEWSDSDPFSMQFNYPSAQYQFAMVTNVQPNNPLNPKANDWILTFRNPIRRSAPNMYVAASYFRMPPRYFGAAGAARTFTLTDTVNMKVRPTSALYPSTAAYNYPSYEVETNWLDHSYINGNPNPRENMMWLFYSLAIEVDFERVITASYTGGGTVSTTGASKQIHVLAEDVNPEAHSVHLMSFGNKCWDGTSPGLQGGVCRGGYKNPDYDEVTDLLSQGFTNMVTSFRRAPLSTDEPYDSYWNCPAQPAAPWRSVQSDWPNTNYLWYNNGWADKFMTDPDLHDGGSGTPPEPIISWNYPRRDQIREFNGSVRGTLLQPPNPHVIEHTPGFENGHTTAYRASGSMNIYEGPRGTLKNPLGLGPADSGGTWFGFTIPTRWYDADALTINGVEFGVVLTWHEDAQGTPQEWMLHSKSTFGIVHSAPLGYYFPSAQVEGEEAIADSFYNVPSASPWPPNSPLPRQMSPQGNWMRPDWPSPLAQVGPFTIRPFNESQDRRDLTYHQLMPGTPSIMVGFL